MRPLRLRMQAFGPYAGEQIVDFRTALGAGLFGIYGPTGSGKSSIFSAISFALFGEPAKHDQDASSLRSDHATRDCLTEVELVFEVGANRYLVRRCPEQMRPALRGEGETRQLHCAWLFDVSGLTLLDITSENCGHVIAERKTREVDEAIERILGYGADQFRQIVLLPQGRFETFLTSKTNDRLKILRELFDVSLYRRLTQKMADDARVAREKILAGRSACQSRLEQEGFQTQEALAGGLQLATVELTAAGEGTGTAQANAKRAEAHLGEGRRQEGLFVEDDIATGDLARLQGKADEISRDKAIHQGALIARNLADVDRAAQSAKEDVRATDKARLEALSAKTGAAEGVKAAAKALADERAKTGELESCRERLANLRRHRITLQNAEGQKTARDKAHAAAESSRKNFESSSTEHERLVAQHRTGMDGLKAANELAGKHSVLSTSLLGARAKLDMARRYQQALIAVTEGEEAVQQSQDICDCRRAELKVTQTAHDEAEAALAGAQAIHLAEKLLPGQPCPVCGSAEHPDIAHGDTQTAGLNDGFKAARTELVRARQSEARAGEALAAAKATLGERQETLNTFEKPDQGLSELQTLEASIKSELDALGTMEDRAELSSRLQALEGQIADAAAKLESARQLRDDRATAFALAKQALESALESVPQLMRENSALEQAISSVVSDIAKREEALQRAIDIDQAAQVKLASATTHADNAITYHENALVKAEAAAKALAERLAIHDLSADQYADHKANIDRIDELQSTIETYGQQLAAAKDRVARARANIAEIERPDVAVLTTAYEEAAEVRQQAFDREAAAKARVTHLNSVSASISATMEKLAESEAAVAPLGELADAFGGRNNAKIELESFAIGAMFDRVLAAANLRLMPMSHGRYRLERQLEGGKGGGRRGLDIAVHDVHTGRARPTSTLSGGESFMAALALALGLSDVVESVSGGIRLDTIFIDEGFGSLDSETLDQALQTLQDIVGESRAVGLISHVDLVQQAIPSGFQIRKTPGGSYIDQRTV
ncbi:MAG: SMC family ATPase [Rhizobiaceae bacterium]